MNKRNIKTWQYAGKIKSEWSDRALDDEDRYAKDSIILTVEVDIKDFESKEAAANRLYRLMWEAWDQWVIDTRGRL